MKKIRIFLAMSAVLLAIGGATASRYFDPNLAYEYQGLDEGVPICAQRSISCLENGTVICATTSAPTVQLKRDASGTQCGPAMWKQ